MELNTQRPISFLLAQHYSKCLADLDQQTANMDTAETLGFMAIFATEVRHKVGDAAQAEALLGTLFQKLAESNLKLLEKIQALKQPPINNTKVMQPGDGDPLLWAHPEVLKWAKGVAQAALAAVTE